MDYTPNVVSKRCFFFIFKHSWGPKRSWKISHGVLESLGKVLYFFPVKEWEPWKNYIVGVNAVVLWKKSYSVYLQLHFHLEL